MNQSTEQRRHPDWVQGIIAMTGYWEPLSFRRRQGATCIDDEQLYEYMHSEAFAEKLASLGVNAAVYHGYKGLGFAFEKEEMEFTRKFGEHCRKYGIHLGTYTNLGSFFAETFFQDTPEARTWLSRDLGGHPHQYSEYYRVYYRYRPCMTHQAFVDYVERMALYLLEHVGSEWILFDNNGMMACYCEHCEREFHAYLMRKYPLHTEASRKRAEQRFGYASLQDIRIPRGTSRMPIDTLPAAHEPVLQEWLEYRCALVTEAYQRLCRKISEVRPNAAISLNPPIHLGDFVPLVWGNDVEQLATGGDLMFSEDENYPHIGAQGQIVGHFPTFKLGRALGQRMLVHQLTHSPEISLGLLEAAILNQGCLGHVGWAQELPGLDSVLSRTLQFIHRHSELFTNTDTLSKVALLRGHTAMVNNWAEAYQSKMMMHQTLYRYGVQYDVVLEKHLSNLAKYCLLVLPNVISLSNQAISHIRDYIDRGGYVLSIENSGHCDEWNRRRFAPSVGLAGERDSSLGSYHAKDSPSFSAALKLSAEQAGRVLHVPTLATSHRFQWRVDEAWMPVIDNRYWVLPENHREVINSVRKAFESDAELIFDEPSYVIPQLLKGGDNIVLHLLNYQYDKTAALRTIRIGLPIETAMTFTLENEEPVSLKIRRDQKGSILEIPEFAVYRVIELKSQHM